MWVKVEKKGMHRQNNAVVACTLYNNYTVYAEYLLSTCANNDERRCQGESTYLSGKG